jgi:DNA modification methylase
MLDDAAETFVPRSRIGAYFERLASRRGLRELTTQPLSVGNVICGDAHKLIPSLQDESIDCVVTSTPYWAVRIYGVPKPVEWADGEVCPLGHEQTPEGFVRHTTEILYLLMPKLASTGSIWWNVGDTFNTRTQIRGNASETLKAMKGLDPRKWTQQNCRRYSAGHAYLSDGEQCLIPHRIAERASRLGYLVKSMISWRKDGSLPEPTLSRVTRSVEQIIHLSKVRAPYFEKAAFRTTPTALGGRNAVDEQDQVTDVWHLPTSSGGAGHGAQFPLALPGRCISLSTPEGATVLDPFAGSGTTGIAAEKLGRRFIGFDVSQEYVALANGKLSKLRQPSVTPAKARKLSKAASST